MMTMPELWEYMREQGIPERMAIHERLINELTSPREIWARRGDRAPLELAIARLHRKGYAIHHMAMAARVTERLAYQMRRQGEIQLRKLDEQEVRDRIVMEE